MTTSETSVRTRPNVLFYLLGFIVVLIGIGLIALGGIGMYATVQDYQSPLRGHGPAALAGSATWALWGLLVITMGRVVLRGARRRGLKDRFGRVLMITALGLFALAIQGFLAGMPDFLGSTTEDEARTRLFAAYLPYLALGFAATIVGIIGGKMAKETEPLITVSAGVSV